MVLGEIDRLLLSVVFRPFGVAPDAVDTHCFSETAIADGTKCCAECQLIRPANIKTNPSKTQGTSLVQVSPTPLRTRR
jgi:hypothetical protein